MGTFALVSFSHVPMHARKHSASSGRIDARSCDSLGSLALGTTTPRVQRDREIRSVHHAVVIHIAVAA